jgi:hypothetical protein
MKMSLDINSIKLDLRTLSLSLSLSLPSQARNFKTAFVNNFPILLIGIIGINYK